MRSPVNQIKEHTLTFMCYFAILLTLLALFGILGKITVTGVPALSSEFLFTSEASMPGFGGAIGNAIVGTILLSTMAPLFASPFAIGTAIYLKKYSKNKPLINFSSFLFDVLSGTPSIVIGIFGFMVFIYYLRYYTGGFSLISGSLALAILILPVIERATELALDTVPQELEEGSYALGATKWDTLRHITLPYALTGIVTGIVLSVGRAAEESAVVILTAGYTQFYPEFKTVQKDSMLFGLKIYPFQDLVASLPLAVYNTYHFPQYVSLSEGFGAAFVLIVIVMIINAVTRLILWRRRIG